MIKDPLDYGSLIDEAMHYVVRRSLEIVSKHGLSNEHHFFITFETAHPGVVISDELKKRYPQEMTIVIQHQYWNLEVEPDGFSVVLSFDNIKQSLEIPFEALISFADPSVKFGLQFHRENAPAKAGTAQSGRKNGSAKGAGKPLEGSTLPAGSNIISLDSFRKKD